MNRNNRINPIVESQLYAAATIINKLRPDKNIPFLPSLSSATPINGRIISADIVKIPVIQPMALSAAQQAFDVSSDTKNSGKITNETLSNQFGTFSKVSQISHPISSQ